MNKVKIVPELQSIIDEEDNQTLMQTYANTIELMPVDYLLRFRDFDRDITADFYEKLLEDIKENGMDNPVILYYNPLNGYSRLSEGNHRLSILIKLGWKYIPVRGYITRYMTPEESTGIEGVKHGGAFVENPILTATNEYEIWDILGDRKPSKFLSKDKVRPFVKCRAYKE